MLSNYSSHETKERIARLFPGTYACQPVKLSDEEPVGKAVREERLPVLSVNNIRNEIRKEDQIKPHDICKSGPLCGFREDLVRDSGSYHDAAFRQTPDPVSVILVTYIGDKRGAQKMQEHIL